MTTPEVLEKIKKLLRLGQSPNPHEAELAVQRAFELASRYQIEIESVNLEDDIRKIVAEKFPAGARTSFARKRILNLLVAFFNVNIVINTVPAWMRQVHLAQPTVTFIGKPVDIQIARYVYDFLHTACARALKEFNRQFRRKPAKSTQQNFVQGFVYGVSRKLEEASGALGNNQHGIIVSEAGRREAFEKTLFDTTKLKIVRVDLDRRNPDALMAGFVEGKKVEIRKPIESNAAGQLLLQ